MSTVKEVSICPSLKIKVVFVASYRRYQYFIFNIHIGAVSADFFLLFFLVLVVLCSAEKK